jgi:ribosomal protein S12 methylthiotransferase accessory factor
MNPSLRRLADLFPLLVDPKVGIVREVREIPREAGAPDFFHFYATAADTRRLGFPENFRNTGAVATDRETALARALGEAVERYSGAVHDLSGLPIVARRDATFETLDPAELALFSEEQYARPGFPWKPFTDEAPVRWTPARDLLRGEELFVPAASVFLPYHPDVAKGETPVLQTISTGLACHSTPEEAAIGGLCEVVERDAFLLTWQARMGRRRIDRESLSAGNRSIAARFDPAHGELVLFDLTTDNGIPCILSVLRGGAGESPALVVAASADLDPEVAARKSLEELAHTRRYSRWIRDQLPPLLPDPPEHRNVVDQITHLLFWGDRANLPLADFLFSSRETVDLRAIPSLTTGDLAGDLRVLAERIAATGHRVLLADVTSPDVEALGLFVLHALVPGYQPLCMGHGIRSLGGRRLREVPPRLGYPPIDPERGDNPAPHPYP